MCGDLGCGAVTVRLTVGRDSVVWSDWGWQTNYSDEISREDFAGFPDLEFDRAEYEGVLRDALDRLTRT
jgi:hypothetical protein